LPQQHAIKTAISITKLFPRSSADPSPDSTPSFPITHPNLVVSSPTLPRPTHQQQPQELSTDVTNFLTPQQIADFRDVFAVFDRNNDNSISASEILDVMASLGQDVTQEQLQDILNEYDIDNSGSIDFEEFLLMMCSKLKDSVDQQEEARVAFKLFDSDGNGKVDVDELYKAMIQLGETITLEDAQNMLNEADLDGDGFIDEEEFCKMMSTF
jgi:Ca2+-binding EF-hand superfamily protein